jgi:DNA polymerase III subunit delta
MPRPTSQIYFFGGSDELAVKEEAQEFADKLVAPKDRDFGLEIVNGFANNTDEALTIINRLREAINTLPFLGGNKIVWLKNTNLYGDLAFARESNTVVEALSELADELKRGLPNGVTLLVSATQIDKRRVLFKLVEKSPETKIFDLPDFDKGGREQITKFAASKFKEEGKSISPDALEMLVEMVGADSRACAQEIEKLVLFTGERKEIREADVEAVVSATADVDIFKLMNAIGERNAAAAMNTLDNLLAQRESVIGIIALTAWNMRQTLLCRDLMDRNLLAVTGDIWSFKREWEQLPPRETSHFPRTKTGAAPSPFGLYRCALAARKYSQKELIAAMNTLLEANRAVVTSGLDDRIVLEEAILKIITGGGRGSVERQLIGA